MDYFGLYELRWIYLTYEELKLLHLIFILNPPLWIYLTYEELKLGRLRGALLFGDGSILPMRN